MSQKLIDIVRAKFGDAVLGSHSTGGDATVLVVREKLVEIMTFLRDDPRSAMQQLVDVTGVDYSEFPIEYRSRTSPVDANHKSGLTSATLPRFEVVYHLLSLSLKHRLRVKVAISLEDSKVPSLSGVWLAAAFGERETWDMYGVRFEGLADHRRILLYEEFEGHPLRKDYPLRGYQPLVSLPTLSDYTDQETYR